MNKRKGRDEPFRQAQGPELAEGLRLLPNELGGGRLEVRGWVTSLDAMTPFPPLKLPPDKWDEAKLVPTSVLV